MNHLAIFTLSVLTAHSVCAQMAADWPKQTPFLSTPYYFYNHQVIPTQTKAPVLYQHDPFTPQRDAMISVLLRELKEMSRRLAETSERLAETNVVVENVKNELAQMKKMVKDKVGAEGSKSNDNWQNETGIKSQAELLAPASENFTTDSDDKATLSARFCNCLQLMSVSNAIEQGLAVEKSRINALTAQFTASTAAKTIGRIPDSCADLKLLGNHRSGIYSVMGVKQVKSVYCDFTKPNNDPSFEKMIGIVDTKTRRVYFHAQRTSVYSTASSTVPFDMLRLNEGGAMLTSGIFTAPTPGTYYFAFSGISPSNGAARVELQLKTATVDWTSIGRAVGAGADFQTFALHATLQLEANDQIRLFLFSGNIQDSSTHTTNFIGFLIDEELE